MIVYGGQKVGLGRSTLKLYGGKLYSLYDSDKWEWGRKTHSVRSWKSYRKTQYKEAP